MTVLLSASALAERATAVAGPLAPLSRSLAADLDAVIAHGVTPPRAKARLTRGGGRCPSDGELLAFEPFTPTRHRCPRCGRVYEGEVHDGWWVMGYQLWLAERAVHAAALYALGGNDSGGRGTYAGFARDALDALSAAYDTYPNRDNVLGPSRPFFSTYLESIWLLQLVIAADLLESRAAAGTSGARLRERIVEPSLALIASYDEGTSNRQVWNVAAMAAADRLLGRDPTPRIVPFVERLEHALLPDGTWFEGENYHLFAHRGLWYIVTIAEQAGIALPREFGQRFTNGFATPFLTALPDLTAPSRRDSPYAVSLRQWRFAELCELGLARTPDDRRLVAALARLYAPGIPRRDTGRSRSTAEAERNLPPTALHRGDLGWRSLLFALPELPPLLDGAPRSVLLEGQGLAVVRRNAGRVYVALDYGETGAGHGHADRLGVLFAHDEVRWLDDPGTGSYTDPALFWYRSTLAHNAPLFDGHSQRKYPGVLEAYEDRGGAGWIVARADGVWPGVSARRTVVVMTEYLLDVFDWSADRDVTCELPVHADGDMTGVGPWHPDEAAASDVPDDGFVFLADREAASSESIVRFRAQSGSTTIDAWFASEPACDWWRAVAPGVPGTAPARFHVQRQRAGTGMMAAVWSWGGAVDAIAHERGEYRITMANGERHVHARSDGGWHIDLDSGTARSSIDLGGVRSTPRQAGEGANDQADGATEQSRVLPRVRRSALEAFLAFAADLTPDSIVLTLGELHYRRSELSWSEAGAPSATIGLAACGASLLVDVDVVKSDVRFATAREVNPLDNEHPDINSDGLQLYLVAAREGEGHARHFAWLIVPEEASGGAVRVTPRNTESARLSLMVRWSPTGRGWAARVAIPVVTAGVEPGSGFRFDCIINDMSPDRERRRGQLVPGGAAGEFVYLQGDRQSSDRHLPFVWPHD